ncbi:hypothetical protein SB659_18805 [Arthrobacter sp. SIMBA_036]|uniref:hypothetical protein n=1 Tax=Arthrobacter sp. SIMBA_036 TaxID=3085778 RepID=UPI00397DA350
MASDDAPILDGATIGFAGAAATLIAMRPSLAELAGISFADATKDLGSLVLQQVNLLGFRSALIDAAPKTGVSKLLAERLMPEGGVLAPTLAQLYGAKSLAGSNVEIQTVLAKFASSSTGSVANANVNGLLQQAAEVRDGLEHQKEINELAAEFLEGQPVLSGEGVHHSLAEYSLADFAVWVAIIVVGEVLAYAWFGS